MKKNILQVVQHMRPGGIETMALDLQKSIPNCNVHIVSLEGDRMSSIAQWPKLEQLYDRLHFINKKPGFQIVTVLKLIHLIKKLKIDGVHTHHIGPLTYGGMAARLSGIKSLIHTEHDAWHLENHKTAKLQRNLVSWLKPQIIADCQTVANRLATILKIDTPIVVLNGVDVHRFHPASNNEKATARIKFNLPQGTKLIGCAARLEEVKGVSFLIEAFNMLDENCNLVIAGAGSKESELKLQASKTKFPNRIKFLGRVEEMPEFFRALDIFCLPSLNEGFPLSPLEAQACNIPVVITDVGGSREAICLDSGSLVPPANANALAHSLASKLNHKPHIDPRNFVMEKATLIKMCQSYGSLLKAGETQC